MMIANIISVLNSKGTPPVPWYLAGGLIPESTGHKIYQPALSPDLATSYINVANPGVNDAVPIVAPSFANFTDYYAWQFNGTTQYISVPGNYTATRTVVIWQKNWAGVYSAGTLKMLIRPVNGATARITTNGNVDLVGPASNSIIGVRIGQGIYRNGVKLATAGSFLGGADYNIFIGCRNAAGPPANYGSGYVLLYADYDFVLSDAQLEALFESMRTIVPVSDSPYKNLVLSTVTPVAYYTMNQKIGEFFVDEMGGSPIEAFTTTAAPSGVTIGHAGPTGKGLAAKGSVSSAAYINTHNDWATETGLNLNQFTVFGRIRNINTDAQARPVNIYSSTGTEYFALEIRSGTAQLFSRENGVTWDTGAIAVVPNDTWIFFAAYNDLANNKMGLYLGTTKYEFTKGTTGFLDTSPDSTFPYILQTMNGFMNNVGYINGIITQEQVNILAA